MKNIVLITLLSLGFTACNTTSSDSKTIIALTAPCKASDDTSSYQILQSGDTISKPETLHNENSSEPEIEIFHTEDGLKKVCINSGSAVILR